jgi:Sec-independent protein translocase protein TatA
MACWVRWPTTNTKFRNYFKRRNMEILGIGMPELIFIVVIALIVLGPKDMQKAGKTIGKWMRDLVTSDGWKIFQQTSREIRTLPTKLMREANKELEQVNQIGRDLRNPLDTLNEKYPASVKSQPISTVSAENKLSTPAEESKENESDPKKDA